MINSQLDPQSVLDEHNRRVARGIAAARHQHQPACEPLVQRWYRQARYLLRTSPLTTPLQRFTAYEAPCCPAVLSPAMCDGQ